MRWGRGGGDDMGAEGSPRTAAAKEKGRPTKRIAVSRRRWSEHKLPVGDAQAGSILWT
jgi:hypothetical protein